AVQLYFAQHVVRLRRLQYALLNEKFGELFFSHDSRLWVAHAPRVLVSASAETNFRCPPRHAGSRSTDNLHSAWPLRNPMDGATCNETSLAGRDPTAQIDRTVPSARQIRFTLELVNFMCRKRFD